MSRIPYDPQFIEECDAMPVETCDKYGSISPTCKGCPAWEGLKKRRASPPAPRSPPATPADHNHEAKE